MIVWHNGGFVSDEKACDIHLAAEFRQGRGVFSTLLVKNGKVVWLDKHIQRLKNSTENLFALSFDTEEITRAVNEWPDHNSIENGIVRITALVVKGQLQVLISGEKMQLEDQIPPVKLQQAQCIRHSSDITARYKTFNRLLLELECERAVNEGFGDVLFLNENMQVTETSKHNIFMFMEGVICTPSLNCGLLPGIGRVKLMRLIHENGTEVQEGFYSLDEILKADEIFVINSVRGVIPVAQINDRHWSAPGPRTLELMALWQKAVELEVLR
ncbi:MAG: aminotransferase class IV [Candidatus Saccharibacteria bacterium]